MYSQNSLIFDYAFLLIGLCDIILWVLFVLERKSHWLMSSSLENGMAAIN